VLEHAERLESGRKQREEERVRSEANFKKAISHRPMH
jgi:hypothetical protein